MTAKPHTDLTEMMETAAVAAGMRIQAAESGVDFHGSPTARFTLAAPSSASATPAERALTLELSGKFDLSHPGALPGMTAYLEEASKRLRNPRPDCYVTLAGLPISFAKFQWPFHLSTSGADTMVVQGEAHLEDGSASPLHAKVAASMTVTFAEIVPAPEQPYAESFVYNAIRKTLDQGQMEMVKSGNRQPVPVTTRYYSRWQKKFIFNDATEKERMDFVALKVYWLSGALGAGEPVWIADPRDAQYLNAGTGELLQTAAAVAGEGLVRLAEGGEFAAATPALMSLGAAYKEELAAALEATKPSFNEEMRAGHTNM